MDDTDRRTVWSILLGVVLIACIAGVLRATAALWWPAVSVYTGFRSLRRFLLSLVLTVLAPVVWVLRERLGWSRVHIVVVVMTGLLVCYLVGGLWTGDRDVAPVSPRESLMDAALLRAVPRSRSLPKGRALFGTTIAVPDERAVARATARIREALVHGLSGGFFHHLITVGGPETESVDAALRSAVRWLPKCRRGNIHITILTPSPISDRTRQTLINKGLALDEIEHAFP
jgi:hypothetical protein